MRGEVGNGRPAAGKRRNALVPSDRTSTLAPRVLGATPSFLVGFENYVSGPLQKLSQVPREMPRRSGFRKALFSVLVHFGVAVTPVVFHHERPIHPRQLFGNWRFLYRSPWKYCAVFVGRASTKKCSSATVKLLLNLEDLLLARLCFCVALCCPSWIMHLSRMTLYRCHGCITDYMISASKLLIVVLLPSLESFSISF